MNKKFVYQVGNNKKVVLISLYLRRGVFCATGTERSDVVYMNQNLKNFSVKNLISTLNAGKTQKVRPIPTTPACTGPMLEPTASRCCCSSRRVSIHCTFCKLLLRWDVVDPDSDWRYSEILGFTSVDVELHSTSNCQPPTYCSLQGLRIYNLHWNCVQYVTVYHDTACTKG
jgi:hypothetical protein